MSTMEENKFEKQVRKKMEELKLNPSDSVWENVKNRIEKRKSRRWEPLIFLFFFVLLLSGGYWFFNSSSFIISNKGGVTNNSKESQSNSSLKNKTGVIEKKDTVSDLALKEKEALNPGTEKKYITKEETIKTGSLNIVKRKINRRQSNRDLIVAINSPEPEVSNSIGKINDELKTNQEIEETVDSNVNIAVTPGKQNEVTLVDNIKENIPEDKSILKELAKPKDTVAYKKSKKSETLLSKNKWNIGILLSAGISHVGNQFLGLGYTPADYSRYPLNNGSTGGGVIITNPSKVKNSGGYVAGVFFEKNISAGTKLSFGVNYKVFSTSNFVGAKSDSAETYKALNASNRYFNHFRFINLPIELKLQLTKNESLPLFWNVGVTLSQMTSSDALQFDPYKAEYFKRNSLFNKTQFGFTTGLSVSLFAKQKFPFSVGPSFYYSASKLSNEGLYNKKHFVFLGLQGQMIIFNK